MRENGNSESKLSVMINHGLFYRIFKFVATGLVPVLLVISYRWIEVIILKLNLSVTINHNLLCRLLASNLQIAEIDS